MGRPALSRNSPGTDSILQGGCIFILAVILLDYVLFSFYGFDLKDKLPRHSICLINTITGKPCPGCGMTRAFLSLGQLNFEQAFKENLLSFFLFPLVAFCAVKKRFPLWLGSRRAGKIILLGILLFWAYRIISK